MEFGDKQIEKRLKNQENTIAPENLPAFYDGQQGGLTTGNHPILGRVKGIRTGNTSISEGNPMPILLTEGLPRFPAPTIESTPPKGGKKRYYWVYFYSFTVVYRGNTIFEMPLTDWTKRQKFLRDGAIIDKQSLSKSATGISIKAQQEGNKFEIEVDINLTSNMSYFADRNPSNPLWVEASGTLELWSSTETIYVARGIPLVIGNILTFTFLGGNPATRQRKGVLQPNNRFKNTIESLPSLLFRDNDPVFLAQGYQAKVHICVYPAILEPKPNIVLNPPVNYFNPDACKLP